MVETSKQVLLAYIDTLNKLMEDIFILKSEATTYQDLIKLDTLCEIHHYMCMKIIGEDLNEYRQRKRN